MRGFKYSVYLNGVVEREWKKGGGGCPCKGGMRFDFVVAEVQNFSSKASLSVKVGAGMPGRMGACL